MHSRCGCSKAHHAEIMDGYGRVVMRTVNRFHTLGLMLQDACHARLKAKGAPLHVSSEHDARTRNCTLNFLHALNLSEHYVSAFNPPGGHKSRKN